MRTYPDSHYETMSDVEVNKTLRILGELDKVEHASIEERKKFLKKIQRTRHLLVWDDTSTVANHGYMVVLVSCLYDPAVYLTDEEYKTKTGKITNIQRIIEEPQLHIIARCGSGDVEQLAYSETRLQCISELKQNVATSEQIEFVDVLRFSSADSPARAFGCGHQKGGHYFCSACGIHADMAYELDHVLNCPLVTLQDRQDAIKGAIARRNSVLLKPKPLSDLDRKELEQELASRGVFEGKTKQELQKLLTKEMQGKQRVPALLYNHPQAQLKDLGLDKYEVLPTEPLHDIGHHIENCLTEIPHHLPATQAKIIKDAVDLCLDKEYKRGVDYRAAIIKVAGYAGQTGKISPEVMLFINTLIEMQRILYAPEKNRTPALILRYYNQSWLHSILLKKLSDLKPKKLTLRKLFGVYFHDLTAHAGLMLRIVCGQSINAEKQERFFNQFKRITNTTSNYNPRQIIPNTFIRLQAQKELGQQQNNTAKQQAYISNLAQCLPAATNTRVPLAIVRKYTREWQAHLQQISDYLLEGQGIWWSLDKEDVVFHDISGHPLPEEAGPQLHHFRSSSLSSELSNLKQCWSQCLENRVTIPIHVIRTDLENGTTKKFFTPYLGDQVIDQQTIPEPEVPKPPSVPMHVDDDDVDDSGDEETVIDMNPTEAEDLHELDVQGIVSQEMCKNSSNKEQANVQPTNELTQFSRQSEEQDMSATQQTPDLEPNESYVFQSKLGKALELVLGRITELIQFDKLHTSLKTKQHQMKKLDAQSQKLYSEMLARIQVKVLAAKTKTNRELTEWDKEFTVNNNFTTPSYNDIKANPIAAALYNKLKFAKALLKEWKIRF